MVGKGQTNTNTILLEVFQTLFHFSPNLLDFVRIVRESTVGSVLTNEIAMTRSRAFVFAVDITTLIQTRSRWKSLPIIHNLDKNTVRGVACPRRCQLKRHPPPRPDLSHRILEKVRQHPEQRRPVGVHGSRSALPDEPERHGNPIVPSREPKIIEADFLHRLQPQIAQVDRVAFGPQCRPLVEAGEVAYVGDHPRGCGDSFGGAIEEFAVLLSFVFVDVALLEAVADYFAGAPECVEGSHDMMEGAGEEAIEHS
mmetsp:Transcript_38392/g.69194  ORF Transcript_38392/g.69194 Transcript_38392/m.69194 type:complete len:254 (-) Transcript_38392:1138-1899(-)